MMGVPCAIILVSTFYAVLRYHFFGDVSLHHLPLFILNKGISFGGLLVLVLSRFETSPEKRRQLGLIALGLIVVHVVLSLPVLTPAYLGKLFLPNGRMTVYGELAVISGLTGLSFLLWMFAATVAKRPMPRFAGRLALWFTIIHVTSIGWQSWIKPAAWPGGLLPITLLSFLGALVGALLPARARKVIPLFLLFAAAEGRAEDPLVVLGRHLFFDKRLSVDGTVSCATCHRPENAFSEPTPFSTGVLGRRGHRKSPTIVNLAAPLYPNFFWDGRASSLEQQVLGPIENAVEMGNTLPNAVRAIAAVGGYGPYFTGAFGSTEVSKERLASALAAYVRSRTSGGSAFDKWQEGDDEALPSLARKGHEVFFGPGRCNQCHLGGNFTDSLFYNLGIGWDARKKTFNDVGRFAITKKRADRGAFKTPGLRDLGRRAPYMHDGSLATLREVVLHYNKGGNPNPYLTPKLRPLNLSEREMEALVVFLNSLEGFGYADEAPAPLE